MQPTNPANVDRYGVRVLDARPYPNLNVYRVYVSSVDRTTPIGFRAYAVCLKL